MSSVPQVVVAGGGIAGAATAIGLRRLGFAVRLLVRRDADVAGVEALPERALDLLEILGEPQLVTAAGGVTVRSAGASPTRVHVERRALARAFLERAQAHGAVVEEVRRLPPASEVDAPAAVDATGRAAAWSRPLAVDGHDVARQFEGAPQADGALRMVQGDRWWAYRLGTPSSMWAAVVVDGRDDVASQRLATCAGLRRLGLDPAEMVSRGRRAARVQRALYPVVGTRIAVGDAALAHDPVAGGGTRFALASAIAAATAIGTWVDDSARHSLAAAYYNDLVMGEHGRHLEARRSAHAPDGRIALLEEQQAPESGAVPDIVWFAATLVESPLAIDGVIRPGAAIRLPDGTLTRWLGSFDLLILARLSSNPVSRIVLLAQLQREGLDVTTARAVLSWAVRHGLLTG